MAKKKAKARKAKDERIPEIVPWQYGKWNYYKTISPLLYMFLMGYAARKETLLRELAAELEFSLEKAYSVAKAMDMDWYPEGTLALDLSVLGDREQWDSATLPKPPKKPDLSCFERRTEAFESPFERRFKRVFESTDALVAEEERKLGDFDEMWSELQSVLIHHNGDHGERRDGDCSMKRA